MSLYDAIYDALENLDESDLISVWNEYCQANSYDDQEIFYMSEFWDIFADGMSPQELVELGRDGDFDPDDEYFQYTIYGPESFSTAWDHVEFDDLALAIERNEDAYGDDTIQEILDNWEDYDDLEEPEDDEEEPEEE